MKALYDLLVITGVCIVMIIAAEIGARVTLRVLARPSVPQETIDSRARLPAYADSTYNAVTYWREFRAAKREVYHPYIVWRQQSSSGSLINVDADGNRVTKYNSDDPDALQVWLMGGSTMWGMGVPDGFTIPSYVARILNEELGVKTRVRNLGEIGFVSTQELTQLIRELQTGRRPDVVIFLDGVNDAPAAALWPEVPGSHMNLYSIRSRFEHRDPDGSNILALVKTTGLYHLAEYITSRFTAQQTAQVNWSTPDSPEAIISQGNRAAQIWMSNIQMIQALGRSFEFEPLFFLQPSLLVGEKTLAPSEQKLVITETNNPAKKAGMDVYAEMWKTIHDILAAKPLAGVYDRTDLFKNTSDPVYIDYVHITERGNEFIARDIVATMFTRQCAESPVGDDHDPASRVGIPCPRPVGSVHPPIDQRPAPLWQAPHT